MQTNKTRHGESDQLSELNIIALFLQFTIPAKDTHYECKVMKAPTFAEKQHIYRVGKKL